MRAALLALGALLALAVVAAVFLFGGRKDEVQRVESALSPAERAGATAPARVAADLQATRSGADEHIDDTRSAAPLAPDSAQSVDTARDVRARIHGRLLDLFGKPIAMTGIARGSESQPIATSDAGGEFSLEREETSLALAGDRWTLVRESEYVEREGARDILLLAAPALSLAGIVVDHEANAIEGAQVSVVLPHSAFAAVPIALDRMREPRRFEVTSDARGRFELRAPAADGAKLTASRDGYSPTEADAPRASTSSLVIELDKVAAPKTVREVFGLVVRPDASPAPGATVHFGDRRAPTSDDGRFVLALPESIESELALVATLAGHRAAILERFGARVDASQEARVEVRLVLGDTPLSITGRVLDAERRPLAEWTVQLVDPTPIVPNEIPPNSAERATLAGGDATARSNADGAFELHGLLDREYRLQAHSTEALLRIESAPIRAGARDVEIVVPADARIERLRGQVIGRDKRVIAGVRVRAQLVVFRTPHGFLSDHSAGVTSDAEGRFELTNVPRRDGYIDVDGDLVIPERFEYDAVDVTRPLIVQLARRCHFRIEGRPAGTTRSWFEVRDARGDQLDTTSFQSGGWTSSTRRQMTGEKTEQLAVSEDARTIVFLDDEERVIASQQLALAPGEIVVVRF